MPRNPYRSDVCKMEEHNVCKTQRAHFKRYRTPGHDFYSVFKNDPPTDHERCKCECHKETKP